MKIISVRTITLAILVIAVLIIILFADSAHAGTSGTAFDKPLAKLRGIFT